MDVYWNMCSECAETARERWKETGGFGALHVYYKPGKLALFHDHETPEDDGWKLATNEGLRGNIPYSAIARWIYDRCRAAPCLPIDS